MFVSFGRKNSNEHSWYIFQTRWTQCNAKMSAEPWQIAKRLEKMKNWNLIKNNQRAETKCECDKNHRTDNYMSSIYFSVHFSIFCCCFWSLNSKKVPKQNVVFNVNMDRKQTVRTQTCAVNTMAKATTKSGLSHLDTITSTQEEKKDMHPSKGQTTNIFTWMTIIKCFGIWSGHCWSPKAKNFCQYSDSMFYRKTIVDTC